MLAALPALLAFAGALLAALPRERDSRLPAWIAAATGAAAAIALAAAGPAVFAGEVPRFSASWLDGLGVGFGFRMDGLAFVFASLVVAVGLLVVLYAAYYLGAEDAKPRFFALLLAFEGAMLGVVLADNLVLLVVFWELTSLASFLLVGYWSHSEEARRGARMALGVTGAGGLCLLAGVLLLGQAAGGFDLDRVLAAGPRVRDDPAYGAILALVLAGAFAKSAQFPLHFWLPHAMAAPTPVSAYLHSATMVKAGVFLLARFFPVLSGTDAWFYTVTAVGATTLLVGATLALFQHDLKGLLAYSTISHLGLITLLFGLATPLAVVAGLFHILNHATFKASLFMAAGILDHETGTRDMRRLNGLWKTMPVTGTLAMTAAAAMAGVPLLNGFLSKEMFFTEALEVEAHPLFELAIPAAAALAGLFAVAYSVRFAHDVFFHGEPVGLARTPHEPPRWMRAPVEVLVVLCVAVGILPAQTVGPVLDLAARAVLGAALPEYSLALWHGWTGALGLSVAATVAGVALYFGLQRGRGLHRREPGESLGRRAYETKLGALRALGARIEERTARAELPVSGRLLIAAAVGLAAFGAVSGGGAIAFPPVAVPPAAAAIVAAVGIAAALATVRLARRDRLAALAALGGAGLTVSLAFVALSAPDLALTQLLVEVAGILLTLVALRHLPRSPPPPGGHWRRRLDAVLALAAGLGMGALAWASFGLPVESISRFFLERALPEGGGTNVVNVIIVDFRGFDTLGEITVLAVAALVAHALLRPGPPAHRAPSDAVSPLLATAAPLLLPFAVLVSVFLFRRGHNQPGGGFIAGLVLAIALLLQYVAGGAARVEARIGAPWVGWVAWGLATAGATGVLPMLAGLPFLTSGFAHPRLPLLGEVPLASAAMFDLGVFLVVVGATILMLRGLALRHAP